MLEHEVSLLATLLLLRAHYWQSTHRLRLLFVSARRLLFQRCIQDCEFAEALRLSQIWLFMIGV